ncbi:hypothetical protein K505DRAFT_339611 [Melanomma pulvis-pyrius CBS 109.77]|uniref:RING-type domain-containing protein n=1 Tax=Melanomma pulvis-pyrius CBS 109.77 TaxID=1314802 RepID=A0A6A6X580_9PLEO|nr:hypothetical protein K505DRAFT_339611 [Melanomma pulvis-pyrius CBS 109.77]
MTSRAEFIRKGLERLTCPICYEGFDAEHDAVQVSNNATCNHIFGKPCIEMWVHSNNAQANQCPICRALMFEPSLQNGDEYTDDGNSDDGNSDDGDSEDGNSEDGNSEDGGNSEDENLDNEDPVGEGYNDRNDYTSDQDTNYAPNIQRRQVPRHQPSPPIRRSVRVPRTTRVNLSARQIRQFVQRLWLETWYLVDRARTSRSPKYVTEAQLRSIIERAFPSSRMNNWLRDPITMCARKMVKRHKRSEAYDAHANLRNEIEDVEIAIYNANAFPSPI